MTNTALGAKNAHTITFKNKEHEKFYLKNNPKMEELYAKNQASRNNKRSEMVQKNTRKR